MSRMKPAVLVHWNADGAPERFHLTHDVEILGRSDSCTIVIESPIVSRLHARIQLQHDRYLLFDEGSANGTFVNGRPVTQGCQLIDGDEIWLGSQDVRFSFDDPDATVVLPHKAAPAALFIDEKGHTVQVYGVAVPLTPLEYGLLLHLASHPGTVCTREASFLAVWGQEYDHASCGHALNTCIAKLRRSLRAAAENTGHDPPQITTVHGVGFRLDADVTFAVRDEDARE